MVEVEDDGISLFSKAPRKKRKAARELVTRTGHTAIPEAEVTHRGAGQDATAALERSGGQAPLTGQATDADDHRTAAADTECVTSTSGRAVEHEGPITFRNLGISEWLDR